MNIMFGTKLKEARLKKGLKQCALGKMVGVSASFISQCENGYKFPRLDIFIKMIDALNVAPNYMLEREIGVATDDTNYLTYLSKKDLEIIFKIKEYKRLYEHLSSERTGDIIESWSHKF